MRPRTRGLTPLDDQKLAGALMWIPPNLVQFAALLALAGRRLRLGVPARPRVSESPVHDSAPAGT